jgi:hypothetical protein
VTGREPLRIRPAFIFNACADIRAAGSRPNRFPGN